MTVHSLSPAPTPSPPLAPTPAPTSATLTLVGCAACFGLVPLFVRLLQAEGMDPAAIALSRYLLTAAVLLPFLPRRRAVRRQALLLLAAGMAQGLGWIGYLEAIGQSSVAAAGVVYMSYPVFAVLFGWLLAGLVPGPRGMASAALVLGAGVMVFGGGPAGVSWALVLSLPAPAFFGLIIVVLTVLTPDLRPAERTVCGMLGAVMGLLPLAVLAPTGALVPATGAGWAALAGSALVTALLPQVMYARAAPAVGPGRAAATGAMELPVMMAVGALAFGEALGPREAAAAVMVVLAVCLAPLAPRPGAIPRP